MIGAHHTAIVTTDVERALRFWRDGLGLAILFDHVFKGDWPTLFDAGTDTLRSIFLGDPESLDAGIVELVVFDDPEPGPRTATGPAVGLFLVSLSRDVDPTLRRLAELSFTEGVRRDDHRHVDVLALRRRHDDLPDGVRVELIGPAR